MSSVPPIPSVGAIDEVQTSFSIARSYGSQAFSTAFSLIDQLASYEPQTIGFDTSFTVPSGILTGFDRPVSPDSPDIPEFDIDVPAAPVFNAIDIPTFLSVPDFDGEPPTLDFSGRPAPFAKTPPVVPEIFDVTIPDAPEISLPSLPTLEELNLPEPPTLADPQFTAVRPEFTADVPDGDFEYEYSAYSSDLLAYVQQEVERMLQGGTGLPPAIEQAIFDRTVDRQDESAMQAIDEAMTEYSSRGFSMPSGLLNKRVETVRQEAQRQRSATNREVHINATQVEIENLRFSITQGIACENLTISLHQQAEELKLRTAEAARNLLLAVFNARVEVFNAEVNAFRVDAEVFRELIRAELAKVEVYRAQIDAERAKSEINQQRIDTYVAQLQGLNTLVAIYTSQVDAARAIAATNEAILRGYASEVSAFGAEVDAKRAEFQAWATQIQGELGKVEAYRAETQAFSARAQAVSVGNEALAIAPRLQLQQQTVEAEQYRAQISGVQAQIQAEAERARAISTVFGAKASIFAAEGSMRASEADANTRQFLALLESSRRESEAALAEAQLNVQQIISVGNQIVEALRGASQAASQLASASFSAVSASATISEQGTASNSWQQSYSVSSAPGS